LKKQSAYLPARTATIHKDKIRPRNIHIGTLNSASDHLLTFQHNKGNVSAGESQQVSLLVEEEKVVISVYPTLFYFILVSSHHPKLLHSETEA
jgi:hypothetical protein